MQKQRKITTKKVGYTTIHDVFRAISKVKAIENSIYSVLRRSNKSRMAILLGISRSSLTRKIKDRKFNLNELIDIFTELEKFTEEEIKDLGIDPRKRYKNDWYL